MSEHAVNSVFKRVGLVAKPGDEQVTRVLLKLITLLDAHDLDVVVDETCRTLLDHSAYLPISPKHGNSSDLVIAIGGDGTLLRAAHMLSSFDVRLLGINLGRLGFLTDISPKELEQKIPEILGGNFQEEKRTILRCSVNRYGQTLSQHDAINDVVVQKWNIARLITFDTYINGHFVHSHRSDGLIVSTPTGSTAYALSAGGPIVHPSLDSLLLVPICPHTLSNRPIIVNGDNRVEIIVGTREVDHARLTCDGEIAFELAPGDCIVVERSDRCIHLIHPAGYDHYATLRAKLNWG